MQTLERNLLIVAVPAMLVAGVATAAMQGNQMDGVVAGAAGLFLAVLVAATFSQGGTVHLSPQREVALATGQSDRRTLFERPLLRPIMWLILAVCTSINMPKAKDRIRRLLQAEGNENYYTPEEFLAVSVASGAVLAVLLVLVTLLSGEGFSLVMVIIGLVVGPALNLLMLYNSANKRLRLITRRVPYALDLVSLAMGAGATFTEAVDTVVREEPNDPFNSELRTVLAEIELGETRRKALENLADRVGLESLRSIVASVIQSEELGTPLGDVLHSQATLMRLQRTAAAENAAAVASVRVLVPSLLILMAVVITVFGPAILRGIRGGLL